MKYLNLYALFLMTAVSISCKGQSKTPTFKDSVQYERSTVASVAPNSMVRNVKEDKNGNILIASIKGVFKYDGKTYTNLTSNISSPNFWDVLEDRKGNLWYGTRDSGVYCYDGKSLQHFTTKDGLPSNHIGKIYEDKSGTIWFGTRAGASRYDGRSFRNLTTKDGLPHNSINTILEDKAGKIWFGTSGEACYYDGKTFNVFKDKAGKAFNNVRAILEDSKGNIWIGGSIIDYKKGSTLYVSTGLWRYDGTSFTKVTSRGTSAIAEDQQGNIWTTGAENPNGVGAWKLCRYDQKSLFNEHQKVKEIMSLNKMLCGIVAARDGSIWFGSMKGVHQYIPK